MNLAIFASGSGSNAENLVNYFAKDKNIQIKCIISNKTDAFVLERAKKLQIESKVFKKADFEQPEVLLKHLADKNIDYIILAGFLLKIPQDIITKYPNKIINIHPSLLPKYGGKGMYGDNVHKAVIANNEKESGITIHYVNSNYDEGAIIFQATCPIIDSDTDQSLANKIHTLEYEYFPKTIKEILNKEISTKNY